MTGVFNSSHVRLSIPDISEPQFSQPYRLSYNKHTEFVVIRSVAFYRGDNPNPFQDCSAESTSCCPNSAITESQIFQFVKSINDAKYGSGLWIYNNSQRRTSEKPHDALCRSWDGNSHVSKQGDACNNNLEAPTSQSVAPESETNVEESAVEDNGPEEEADQEADELTKRRRLDQIQHVKLTPKGRISQNTIGNPQNAKVKFTTECAEAIEKGLKEVGKTTAGQTREKGNLRNQKKLASTIRNQRLTVSDLGNSLAQCQKKAHSSGIWVDLANILGNHQAALDADSWLTDMLRRFVRHCFRTLGLKHNGTGDPDAEQDAKKQERICEVMAALVNNLEPHWGVCALLVFTAFREMNFKGSSCTKFAWALFPDVITTITASLQGKTVEITIPEDTLVFNPAWFISCVTKRSCSDTCTNIGLGNFAYLNVQVELDRHSSDLANLALMCGRIPLSFLLAKEQALDPAKGLRQRRIIEKRGDFLVITLTFPGGEHGPPHPPPLVTAASQDTNDDEHDNDTAESNSSCTPRITQESSNGQEQHALNDAVNSGTTPRSTIAASVRSLQGSVIPQFGRPERRNLTENWGEITQGNLLQEPDSGQIAYNGVISGSENDVAVLDISGGTVENEQPIGGGQENTIPSNAPLNYIEDESLSTEWSLGQDLVDRPFSNPFEDSADIDGAFNWPWTTVAIDSLVVNLASIGSGGDFRFTNT
ncbi:hypothetical protein BX600DRAFT_470098 [Xylariales sp. PMI_506]|nr:hypothetical protein BX600DRAFT_470098 [Xylariales sp. PMI_506]